MSKNQNNRQGQQPAETGSVTNVSAASPERQELAREAERNGAVLAVIDDPEQPLSEAQHLQIAQATVALGCLLRARKDLGPGSLFESLLGEAANSILSYRMPRPLRDSLEVAIGALDLSHVPTETEAANQLRRVLEVTKSPAKAA